ncbi:MAG TPA: DUF1385 domain-containing protein [Solirubrobacteraceae bacterium]|nr:DUF1385 domain-containing protein [Solirubrobacteraceae bacterium]
MATAQAAGTREAAPAGPGQAASGPASGSGQADVDVEVDSHGQLNAERDAPVGGQAVLEGVMMRGIAHWAVAVRKPTPEQLREPHRSPEEAALGDIEVTAHPLKSALQRHRVLRLPIIRGIVALGGSLAIGFRALEVSANAQLPPEDRDSAPDARAVATSNGNANPQLPLQERDAAPDAKAAATSNGNAQAASNGATPPPQEAETGDGETKPQEISGVLWVGTIVVAVALAIVLFFLVPVGLTSLIKGQLNSSVLFWVVEGLVRTAIFLIYMLALSRVRDLRRVFEYHGAEHKTISCFEAGLPLTPVNAQRFSRLHPRCGTSFLLVVMIVAIFVFAPIGLPAWYWLVLTRILGVPLIAGISFELIKFAGRNRRRHWVRALMWPGLKLQLLTTREPDLDQLAVAIAALEAILERETPGQLNAADLVGVEVVA